ncbi:hypothetical protein LG943_15755 [Streptomonospora sp. S1-112]|uniref:Uncharacterized protein n=1 Tax=Streptomonospora mangrovi TaxID=2883123 RepID=A0A9X3NP57_9ACTN|nr:hypothetical protein [Streptomonospora mangrovi]MDA0565758.1 hypothetical protein [Streptomonospora mangrovi]
MTTHPSDPGDAAPERVEHCEDLIDGAAIDRVKGDIRAGRDEMVPFRVADYE